MSNKPKIILLCGGKGERLRPLTIDMPKPLIQINKKPIISYIIEHLESFKLDEFIITTGYKADKIDSYMKELKPSFTYRTVNSGETDIIQRIKDSSKYIDTDFMILYGDTLSDLDIDKFLQDRKCEKKSLPRIYINDPIVKYYNLKIGNIIRIIRPSGVSGKVVSYRLVVNGKMNK